MSATTMKTDRAQKIVEQYGMKNWKLKTIARPGISADEIPLVSAGQRCEYCNANLKYVHVLVHSDNPSANNWLFVGSECLRSFVDVADPQEAVKFLKAAWRQKNKFFWKRFRDENLCIGQTKNGSWWVARTPSVKSIEGWDRSKVYYPSAEAAKEGCLRYVAKQMSDRH